MPGNVAFIAIHAGAGYHSAPNHQSLKHLIEAAAVQAINEAKSSHDAVRIALCLLEVSELTNSGNGSCLTETGGVECEASVMVGNGSFAAVGAVTGVQNPINVAYELVDDRNRLGLIKELGRVRPLVLVGPGAYEFAQSRQLSVAKPEEMQNYQITDDTRSKWRHYTEAIAAHKNGEAAKKRKMEKFAEQQKKDEKEIQSADDSSKLLLEGISVDGGRGQNTPEKKIIFSLDAEDDKLALLPPVAQHGTIGAIACDFEGRVSAASSSGGIWMKSPGRLGCSAMMGCGCYAEDGDDEGKHPSVAASLSGCGEDIMEQLMAARACDAMKYYSDPKLSSSSTIDGNIPDGNSNSSMKSIMTRVLVKKVQHTRRINSQTKKRQHNDSGSSDTLSEDDGLSTGIIALKVQPIIDGMKEFKLAFCMAHTAPHFAVGLASMEGTKISSDSWISMQASNQKRGTDMVIEEKEFNIQCK